MEYILGTALVLVVKLCAYTAFLRWLDGARRATKGYFLFAGMRLAIGLALGGLVLLALPGGREQMLALYFGAIAGARLLAWGVVIALLRRPGVPAWRFVAAVLGATLLSYAVEIPVLLGVVSAIGGIC